jgi:excisionase family DNA binding protein
MTLVQSRDDRMLLSVDEIEVDEARSLSDHLAQATISAVTVEFDGPDAHKVSVPSGLAGLMQAVIDGIGRGAQVTIQSVPRELTTTTAAKMLGVSRPTLVKLVAEGKLPGHKVGSHTRVLAADVAAFRDDQREAQRRAFGELREMDDDLEFDL